MKTKKLFIALIASLILSFAMGAMALAEGAYIISLNANGTWANKKSEGKFVYEDQSGAKVVFDSSDLDTLANNIKANEGKITDNGKTFYFGYQDGKYGYYTDESKGADSFVPFPW